MPHHIPFRPPRPAFLIACLLLAGACDAPREPMGLDPSHAAHGRASQPAGSVMRQLTRLRLATAPYRSLQRAKDAGYSAEITPCWQHRTLGAMGYHHGNPALIDGTVELLKPELLMYEPQRNGRMKLVGLEYIVPIDAWTGESPPTLLGQTMHRHSSLPIYKLHIWLWEPNPRGVFSDWNPRVSCVHADSTEVF